MKNQIELRMDKNEADQGLAGYSAWLPTAQVDFSMTLNHHRRDPKSDDLTMVNFGFCAANELLVA